MFRKIFFLILTTISVYAALAAPVKTTSKQQQNALNNLRAALAAKPEASKQGDVFKGVLTKWVQETDDKTLRVLVSRMQYPPPNKSLISKRPQVKVNRLGHQYPSYEDSIPPQLLLKRIQRLGENDSVAELKVFLSAMDTSEGQKAIKEMNIKQAILSEILKQLSGDVDQQEKARSTFKTLWQSVTQKELPKIRKVYKLYLLYALRLKADELIQKSTPEQMNSLLTALTNSEKRYKFNSIRFSNFRSQAITEVGRKNVVKSINKWISTANIKDLRRFLHYGSMSQDSSKSLQQVKNLISKKIEKKSSEQLIDFLEVLETSEGKSLLNKLSIKPSSGFPELIEKLKSGKESEVIAVKKILQDWISKLTVNDLKEFQNSKMLFIHHRARKIAAIGIQKTDEKTLLSILTYLAKKESTGVKFDGISFTDLKSKLEKNGSKAIDEVKKSMLEWIKKIKLDQLATLKSAHPDKSSTKTNKIGNAKKTGTVQPASKAPVKTTTTVYTNGMLNVQPKAAAQINTSTIKPTTAKTTTKAPGAINATTTANAKIKSQVTEKKPATKNVKAKNLKNPAPVTITKLSEVKNAELFQRFILMNESKVPVRVENVKKALQQIIQHSTNEDITAIFSTTTRGLSGHVVKLLPEGLVKSQTLKFNERIKKSSNDKQWKTLRQELNNWVSKWKKTENDLFIIWFKRGAEGKK